MSSPLNTMNVFMIVILVAAALAVFAKADPALAPVAPDLRAAFTL